MNLNELKAALVAHPESTLRFELPGGALIPAHAHVTEVARMDKHFIDCGGTLRQESKCQLQIWTATDFDHRLNAGKLAKILALASTVLPNDELELGAEYETSALAQYSVESVKSSVGELWVRLGARHTGCLAEDQCMRPASPTQSIQFRTK
jgi:hypothetical protein